MVWNVWCVHWPVNQSVKSPTCRRVFSQDLSSLVHLLLACPRKCSVSELFMNVRSKDVSSLSSWGVHVPGCQISEIWGGYFQAYEISGLFADICVSLCLYIYIYVYICILTWSEGVYVQAVRLLSSRWVISLVLKPLTCLGGCPKIQALWPFNGHML